VFRRSSLAGESAGRRLWFDGLLCNLCWISSNIACTLLAIYAVLV
jgi:hypothetical protein